MQLASFIRYEFLIRAKWLVAHRNVAAKHIAAALRASLARHPSRPGPWRLATARARRGPLSHSCSFVPSRCLLTVCWRRRVLFCFLAIGRCAGRRQRRAGVSRARAGARAYLVYLAHGARGGVLQPLLLHLLRAHVARRQRARKPAPSAAWRAPCRGRCPSGAPPPPSTLPPPSRSPEGGTWR